MNISILHSGISISCIVQGYLVQELYIGYTVSEAKKLFRSKYLKTN